MPPKTVRAKYSIEHDPLLAVYQSGTPRFHYTLFGVPVTPGASCGLNSDGTEVVAMREIRLARTMSYASGMVSDWLGHGANLRGIMPRLTGLRRVQVPAGREGKSPALVLDAGSTPLLARSAMTIEVLPLGPKTSEVRVRLDYAIRCGILGSLADALLLNAMLSMTLKLMLRNLDMSLCNASTLCP